MELLNDFLFTLWAVNQALFVVFLAINFFVIFWYGGLLLWRWENKHPLWPRSDPLRSWIAQTQREVREYFNAPKKIDAPTPPTPGGVPRIGDKTH